MTKQYFLETAQDYIEKYTLRLNTFIEANEESEDNFISKEILLFENCIKDIQNIKSSAIVTSVSGKKILNFIQAAQKEIGYETFLNLNNQKINFLEDKSWEKIMNYIAENNKEDGEIDEFYFLETAKEYSEKYILRLNIFLKAYEALEIDFVKSEIKIFENCIDDIQDIERGSNGFSTSGTQIFHFIYKAQREVSYKTLFYSTSKKISFLEGKMLEMNNKIKDDLFAKNEKIVKEFDPLSLIDPTMQKLFKLAENKATSDTQTFTTLIRCAAFCELLYEKKYLMNTNSRIKTMTTFAKGKYALDISKALATSKNTERNEHKTKVKNNFSPLKNCF